MQRRRLLKAIGGSGGAIAMSGCTGDVSLPDDTSPTSTSTSPPEKTSPSSTHDPSATSPESTACQEELRYDIEIPPEPDPVTESRAADVVKTVEKRYQVARLRADHDDVSIDSTSVQDLQTEQIEGGFAVTIRLYIHYSTDQQTGQYAYPGTYRVTTRAMQRGDRFFACW